MGQDERYDENQPHTYGEESEYYERQDRERAAGRSQGGYGGPGSYGNPGGSGAWQTGQGYAGGPGAGNPGGYGNQQPGAGWNPGGGTGAGNPGNYGNQQSGLGFNQPGYGPGGYTNQPYGGIYGPGYGNPYTARNSPYGYGGEQPWHGPVKDLYCYIVLAVMVLRMLVLTATSWIMFGVIDDYYSLINGSYVYRLQGNTLYTALANISSLLFFSYIVFVVMDIVAVNRANYKITGLILFAIFFTPGYYLWRTHILGRKKTPAIIYTVCYSLLVLANVVMIFAESFSLAMGLMQNM